MRKIFRHSLPVSGKFREILDQAIKMAITHKRFRLGSIGIADMMSLWYWLDMNKKNQNKKQLKIVFQVTKWCGKRNGQSTISKVGSSTCFFTGIDLNDISQGSAWPALNARSKRPRSAADLMETCWLKKIFMFVIWCVCIFLYSCEFLNQIVQFSWQETQIDQNRKLPPLPWRVALSCIQSPNSEPSLALAIMSDTVQIPFGFGCWISCLSIYPLGYCGCNHFQSYKCVKPTPGCPRNAISSCSRRSCSASPAWRVSKVTGST